MKVKLRDNWYELEDNPLMIMRGAGVYQWTIDGHGVYVGKAKYLEKRLRAYPRNVLAIEKERPWHGNPDKNYRKVHSALHDAYKHGKRVTVRVLEICDPAKRAERERYWIGLRRDEAKKGGPPVLNS